MRTELAPGLVMDTKGYDVVEALEKSGDMEMAEWMRDKITKHETMAREYLLKKERSKFYFLSGVSAFEHDDSEVGYMHALTDKEVDCLKEACSRAYAEYAETPGKGYSIEEITADLSLNELEGLDDELDKFLIDLCYDQMDMHLHAMDLEHPHYLYQMSCRGYNERRGEMMNPVSFKVSLTDDEYVYLLSQQLMNRYGFNFNRLLLLRPELAQKICERAESAYCGWICSNNMPFLIQMDDVRADAEAIAGPEPITCQLYGHSDGDIMRQVVVNTEGRSMSVFEEIWKGGEPFEPMKTVEDISADEVMKVLNAKNYFDGVDIMTERFGSETGYQDFKAFLEAEHISYKEKIGYPTE